MDTKKVASELDEIADALEAKGLQKEAMEIDIIANTLEATNYGSSPHSGRPWEISKDKPDLHNFSGKSVKDLEDMRESLYEEAQEIKAQMSSSQFSSSEKLEMKSRLEAIKDEDRRIEEELSNKAKV